MPIINKECMSCSMCIEECPVGAIDISDIKSNDKKELPQEDIEEIMKIKSGSKTEIPPIEIKPETRPDPKPKELDWHETKSGRPLQQLRFIRY